MTSRTSFLLVFFLSAVAISASAALPRTARAQQCDDEDNDNDGRSCLAGDCDDSDPTIYLGAPELCDGKDNDCNDVVDDPQDNDRDGRHECQGDCDDNDPQRFPGNPEVCDGKDNDCNPATLDTALRRACYTFAPATRGVGECRDGREACNGTAWSGTCSGQRGPSAEICDDLDNDCDNSRDEGFDADGDGVTTCAVPPDCDDTRANVRPGGTEVCDGLDNDCDTLVDERNTAGDKIQRACWTGAASQRGQGICHDGNQLCNAAVGSGSASWGTCDGQQLPTENAGTPADPERICDGLDGDCDGTRDDGFDADGDGFTTCGGDCDDTRANVRPGGTEVCDGLDNDCDGPFDESSSGNKLRQDCWTGAANQRSRGICRDGSQECNASENSGTPSWGSCDGQQLPLENAGNASAAETICDGLDGDCDGVIDDLVGINDDGDPRQFFDCSVCNLGTDPDGLGPQPAPVRTPAQCDCRDDQNWNYPTNSEVCDGRDNDCRGRCFPTAGGPPGGFCYVDGDCPSANTCVLADENFDNDGDGCTTCGGDCNDNNRNVYGCFGGAPEASDCIDNDCDNSVDELNPDADGDGYRAGTLACHDCNDNNRLVYPGANEDCDGLDNDCDARVDNVRNTNTPISRGCYTGPAGTAGVGICRTGTEVCNSSIPAWGTCSDTTPRPETCNNADDDCDRSTDEDFDVDRDGVTTCATPPDCDDSDPDRRPGASEVCDGKDNDCSASTNDSALTRPCYTGPAGTSGVGECRPGSNACLGAQGYDSVCTNEVTPAASDDCDGKDNDCDRDVDEGFDQDGDGYTSCGGDCDDQNADIHPGVLDICNNVDDDCDGNIDGNNTPCYTGPPGTEMVGECRPGTAICVLGQPESCTGDVVPTAELCDGKDNDCDGRTDEDFDVDGDSVSTCAGDCDDANPFVAAGMPERCDCMDNDCDLAVDEDGFGGSVCEYGACHDFDTDGFTNCDGDCDDRLSSVFPGAPEICGDGIDNDCDGFPDEDVDEDGDGYTTCGGDCNDRIASIHPGAPEECDGFDNDCDPTPPLGNVCSPTAAVCTYAQQCCSGLCGSNGRCLACGARGGVCTTGADCCSGFCNPTGRCASQVDEGFDLDNDGATTCTGDCDDGDAARSPLIREICGNRIDDDCDGLVDPEVDVDGDGFTACGGDCNDFNRTVYPGAEEVCDRQDNDCDNRVDEGFDVDGDRWVTCFGDCDDQNAAINPDAREVVDGIDNNCNGLTDEGRDDLDGDGFSYLCGDCDDSSPAVSPQSIDVCDSQDNDCDGRIDQDPFGKRSCQTCNDVDQDGVTDCDGDCNDLEPRVRPGGTEVCDGLDNNCDGKFDLDPFTDENLCVSTDAGSVDGTTPARDAGVEIDDAGETADQGTTRGEDVIKYGCGCKATSASAGADRFGVGALVLAAVLFLCRTRRGFTRRAGRHGGRGGRCGRRGHRPSSRRRMLGLLCLALGASPLFVTGALTACTRFDVGGRVDDGVGREDAGVDASADDGGLDGAVFDDAGPTEDAEPGDHGPYNSGPCRFIGGQKARPTLVTLPLESFQIALHPGITTTEVAAVDAVSFMDEARGLYGFAARLPEVVTISTSSRTASREYVDQFIDPLFARPLPGVIGVAERVDETFRQNFSRVNHLATRTFRTVAMVNDVLPSRVRDGILSALSGASIAELGDLGHPATETPTRGLRLAAYVEADALALAYNVVVIVSSVAESDALATRFGDLTNGTHIGVTGIPVVLRCEDQIARSLRVDFIWSVDNSASMQEEQEALAQAADAFLLALDASQIDYRLGVVTTDGEALRGGGFTSDVDEFKRRVRVGVNGNGWEMGLEFAVRAVEHASTSTRTEERLRDDATPVVVFYSDDDSKLLHPLEESIGALRARGVLAFAIVGPRPRGCLAIGRGVARRGESYIQVAEALGGTSASICADDLTGPIAEILVTAAGAASQTQLAGLPISGSLELALPTSTVTRSRIDGFDYEPSQNALIFFGGGNLAEGTPFRVTYLEFLPFNP